MNFLTIFLLAYTWPNDLTPGDQVRDTALYSNLFCATAERWQVAYGTPLTQSVSVVTQAADLVVGSITTNVSGGVTNIWTNYVPSLTTNTYVLSLTNLYMNTTTNGGSNPINDVGRDWWGWLKWKMETLADTGYWVAWWKGDSNQVYDTWHTNYPSETTPPVIVDAASIMSEFGLGYLTNMGWSDSTIKTNAQGIIYDDDTLDLNTLWSIQPSVTNLWTLATVRHFPGASYDPTSLFSDWYGLTAEILTNWQFVYGPMFDDLSSSDAEWLSDIIKITNSYPTAEYYTNGANAMTSMSLKVIGRQFSYVSNDYHPGGVWEESVATNTYTLTNTSTIITNHWISAYLLPQDAPANTNDIITLQYHGKFPLYGKYDTTPSYIPNCAEYNEMKDFINTLRFTWKALLASNLWEVDAIRGYAEDQDGSDPTGAMAAAEAAITNYHNTNFFYWSTPIQYKVYGSLFGSTTNLDVEIIRRSYEWRLTKDENYSAAGYFYFRDPTTSSPPGYVFDDNGDGITNNISLVTTSAIFSGLWVTSSVIGSTATPNRVTGYPASSTNPPTYERGYTIANGLYYILDWQANSNGFQFKDDSIF